MNKHQAQYLLKHASYLQKEAANPAKITRGLSKGLQRIKKLFGYGDEAAKVVNPPRKRITLEKVPDSQSRFDLQAIAGKRHANTPRAVPPKAVQPPTPAQFFDGPVEPPIPLDLTGHGPVRLLDQPPRPYGPVEPPIPLDLTPPELPVAPLGGYQPLHELPVGTLEGPDSVYKGLYPEGHGARPYGPVEPGPGDYKMLPKLPVGTLEGPNSVYKGLYPEGHGARPYGPVEPPELPVGPLTGPDNVLDKSSSTSTEITMNKHQSQYLLKHASYLQKEAWNPAAIGKGLKTMDGMVSSGVNKIKRFFDGGASMNKRKGLGPDGKLKFPRTPPANAPLLPNAPPPKAVQPLTPAQFFDNTPPPQPPVGQTPLLNPPWHPSLPEPGQAEFQKAMKELMPELRKADRDRRALEAATRRMIFGK